MEWRSLDSSVISAVGYDRQTAALLVRFVSGDTYRYFAVPQRVHRELVEAESPGRYFAEHVRSTYPNELVR